MSRSKFHVAARTYAAAGIPVFPCSPGEKRPLAGSKGLNEATTDLKQIDKWWTENPDANIAFTPHAVGLGVVDIDGDAGRAAWFQLDLEHDFPETRTITTPRGGQHLYFKGEIPTSAWAPERKRCLGEHIDTRGPGSYALLPPSVTEDGEYRLTLDVEPAPVPDWIVKKLQRVETARKAKNVEIDSPANIARVERLLQRYVKRGHVAIEGEGGSNRTYHIACEVLDAGLSPETALAKMEEMWNPHCLPVWQSDELQTIIENAARYQQNEPGSKVPKSASETFKAIAKTIPLDIIYRMGSEIEPEPIEWLWHNRIPRGMPSLLAGHGDVGKTTLLLDLCARITRGAEWPDGAGKAPKGTVIYLSAEDSPNKVIIPRFIAAGGDRDKFCLVEGIRGEDDERRTFHIGQDLARLGALLERLNDARLVVLDPISSYFGSTDTWRNTEVRAVLEPVTSFVEKYNVALIGNTHLSKSGKGNANLRMLDSVAISALARSVYMVGKDPDDSKVRLFVPSKGNNGPDMTGLRFSFETRIVKPGVVAAFPKWDGSVPIEMSAEDMLDGGNKKRKNSEDRQREDAERFLLDVLKGGPLPAKQVMQAGLAEHLKTYVLTQAIRALRIETCQQGSETVLKLPGDDVDDWWRGRQGHGPP